MTQFEPTDAALVLRFAGVPSVMRLPGLDDPSLWEVAPPFDPSGLTALTGASPMFELFCAIAAGRRA
ncbi:MAG TPA: hypothetical protein VNC39_16770 [Acidocella sp.]|jgi:hypothetical protein|uniref:hypothetical protein n=1 Tax=Acidocella sp. TaxID=50710 RepID=UPI002C3AF526|nr:hypothetical protein [Acidocella sp.]HVE23623.1 hypothetical protein [Acidocella sp.]